MPNRKSSHDWAAELNELLMQADDATLGNDANGRTKAIKDLRRFCKLVPVQLMPLYNIASKAIIDLGIADMESALNGIHARTKELEELTALMQTIGKTKN